MPLSEPDGYAQGHFSRVYDYIVAPACKLAELKPFRMDDSTTTAFQVMKDSIESDVVICDLSSANASVLYGFAIRKGCNLPLILISDLKSKSMLDVQRDVEYDDSLRIDTVQKAIEALAQVLRNTYTAPADITSLVGRLGMSHSPMAFTGNTPNNNDYSTSADYNPPVASSESETLIPTAIPTITPLPDYVGELITEKDIDKIKAGDFLFHISYGKGEISSIKILAKEKIANILFESGAKFLVLGTTGYFRKVIG